MNKRSRNRKYKPPMAAVSEGKDKIQYTFPFTKARKQTKCIDRFVSFECITN